MGNKVIHAVTSSISLNLMRGQLNYLQSQGYEVKVISSEGEPAKDFEEEEGVSVLRVNMEREISLVKDFKSLMQCIKVMRKEKPDIVTAGTPKAGLLVTLAAYICGVPIRIYKVRGLRMETATGIKRQILLTAEKISAASATHVLAVSPSLKQRVVELGIAPDNKVVILGKGSSNGFKLERFQKTEVLQERIAEKRKEYGLTEKHIVLGFVGRMTKDKGIEEMVEAFLELQKAHANLRLLIIGNYEEGDPVSEKVKQEVISNPNIIHAGFQKDPVPFYYLMNIFVFLTKREGFGNVSIEAALTGLPVIASNVTGAKDTIIDGKTGYLVDVTSNKDITEKINSLVSNSELRNQMALNGKKWAEENFSNEQIWHEMNRYYQTLLASKVGVLSDVKPS
ncbi:glycosyltransferase family 4 protein [Planococcus shixiaomingii]|uniref:glycosyltransferase family 4 protein n=1 Tax=Planococcus shixiaomingii TaxID=3058393 RepID=UPI00260399F5|nr:glycosyltransferase family 4 protein [Planococcus sp. N022]WKA53863.1 glycosyltransferase family 4 protein [Planococcus sp. N022]